MIINITDEFDCNQVAEKCLNIIRQARQNHAITINGSWERADYGYGVYGDKYLCGDYDICIKGMHFTVHIKDIVKSIRIDNVVYEFYEKTPNTIFLLSTIRGYFQEQDQKEAERIEQQKQQEIKDAQHERKEQINNAQYLLEQMSQKVC